MISSTAAGDHACYEKRGCSSACFVDLFRFRSGRQPQAHSHHSAKRNPESLRSLRHDAKGQRLFLAALGNSLEVIDLAIQLRPLMTACERLARPFWCNILCSEDYLQSAAL